MSWRGWARRWWARAPTPHCLSFPGDDSKNKWLRAHDRQMIMKHSTEKLELKLGLFINVIQKPSILLQEFFCLWNPEIISISQCFNFPLKEKKVKGIHFTMESGDSAVHSCNSCTAIPRQLCVSSERFWGPDMGAKLTPYTLHTTRKRILNARIKTECILFKMRF